MKTTLAIRYAAIGALALATALTTAGAGAVQTHHVTGTVTYRATMTVDPEARVWVSLQDVTRTDASAKLIAHTLIRPRTQMPLPFDIAYDPDDIVATHVYAVRASLIVDGVLRYTTDTHYPVITHGHPTVVHLTLVSATASHMVGSPTETPAAAPSPGAEPSPGTSPALESTAWGLTSVNGHAFTGTADAQPYLQFDAAEKHLSGFSGCNRLTGGYKLDGSSLHLGPVGSTMMACPPGVENDEFVKALDSITSYSISGSILTLYAGTAATITLEPKTVKP